MTKRAFKKNVYEFIRGNVIEIGTADELEKLTGVKQSDQNRFSKKIGIRHIKVRAEHREHGDVYYGTLEELEEVIGIKVNTMRNAINKRNGEVSNYILKDTGEYIIDYIRVPMKPIDQPQAKKKSERTYKPVPMSEYGKQLFEWSTRHLRRDA